MIYLTQPIFLWHLLSGTFFEVGGLTTLPTLLFALVLFCLQELDSIG